MWSSNIYEQVVDQHPNSFTAQIITLDAHCSNLQARLLTTLDALDDLQRSHRVELDELHRRIDIRRAQSAFLTACTKRAEAECDTLKEAANELIAKGGRMPFLVVDGLILYTCLSITLSFHVFLVGFANDYRVLPHSGIYLPYPLGFHLLIE